MLRDLYEARRRRRFREEVGNIVVSAGLAAIVGAAAGLLLAPKSGKETREEIAESTKEMAESVRHGARDIADEVYIRGLEAKRTARDTVDKLAVRTEKVIADVTHTGEEIFETAHEKVNRIAGDVKDKAEDFAEDAKDKVEEVKEATEDLKEDLQEKGEEVKEDVMRFGRDISEEVENPQATEAKDLEYEVCETVDLSCKVPEDRSKNK